MNTRIRPVLSNGRIEGISIRLSNSEFLELKKLFYLAKRNWFQRAFVDRRENDIR